MTKGELIKDLEENIYCRLKPSSVHGIGVFAIRDIPKGVNPFRGCRISALRKIKREEIMSNPHIIPEVKEYVSAIYPVYDGIIYMPAHGINAVDISYFLNHSDTPNLKVQERNDDFFIAARKIKEDEELFADYNMYNDKNPSQK